MLSFNVLDISRQYFPIKESSRITKQPWNLHNGQRSGVAEALHGETRGTGISEYDAFTANFMEKDKNTIYKEEEFLVGILNILKMHGVYNDLVLLSSSSNNLNI